MSNPNPQKTVFISYRRSVSSYVAQAIFQYLRAKRYDVFMDVASMDSGTFDTIIVNQIAARAHFLVICTPGTFDRCTDPSDWLRREIETAIEQRRNVVPVLANGFDFEGSKLYLTGNLADLPRLNALLLVHDLFDECMARLRNRFLKQPVAGALLPTPKADRRAVAEKIEQAAALPAPTKKELTAEEFFYQALARADDDWEGQFADLSEALKLNPEYAQAYMFRGVLRDDKGDLMGAIADYDQAIHFGLKDTDAHNNRGVAREKQGDLEGAITDYTEAIRLDPDNVLACINRGSARAEQDNFVGAIANYTRAIQLDPMNASIFNDRGNARYNQGNLDGAIADYDEAIRLDPKFGDAHYNRGKANFAAAEFSQAFHDFAVALKRGFERNHALAGLAIAKHAMGGKRRPLSHWRKLADSDPRCLDAEWVGKELSWRPELVEAARRLIAELNA